MKYKTLSPNDSCQVQAPIKKICNLSRNTQHYCMLILVKHTLPIKICNLSQNTRRCRISALVKYKRQSKKISNSYQIPDVIAYSSQSSTSPRKKMQFIMECMILLHIDLSEVLTLSKKTQFIRKYATLSLNDPSQV